MSDEKQYYKVTGTRRTILEFEVIIAADSEQDAKSWALDWVDWYRDDECIYLEEEGDRLTLDGGTETQTHVEPIDPGY